MASTFRELFSDFQDSIKIYTEKLDFTELSFMRLYTRGIQIMQRDVELIKTVATISRGNDNSFVAPIDMLRPIEIKDKNNYTLLMQDYKQQLRNEEKWDTGYLETPIDWNMRMRNSYHPDPRRIITILNRTFRLHPQNENDTEITLAYVPDLHAISSISGQWADWFPIDDNFDTQFDTASLHPTLAPYENSFLNYAIAQYVKSQGSANYKVFEKQYEEDKKIAEFNQPTMMREAVRSYFIAPYS